MCAAPGSVLPHVELVIKHVPTQVVNVPWNLLTDKELGLICPESDFVVLLTDITISQRGESS